MHTKKTVLLMFMTALLFLFMIYCITFKEKGYYSLSDNEEKTNCEPKYWLIPRDFSHSSIDYYEDGDFIQVFPSQGASLNTPNSEWWILYQYEKVLLILSTLNGAENNTLIYVNLRDNYCKNIILDNISINGYSSPFIYDDTVFLVSNRGLIKVDPFTGEVTTVSSKILPYYICVAFKGETAVFYNQKHDTIYYYNILTGLLVRKTITVYGEPLAFFEGGMITQPEDNRFFILDFFSLEKISAFSFCSDTWSKIQDSSNITYYMADSWFCVQGNQNNNRISFCLNTSDGKEMTLLGILRGALDSNHFLLSDLTIVECA